MKKLKNPTREQRKIIKAKRLAPENWMIERDTPDTMVIVHRFTSSKRLIQKG